MLKYSSTENLGEPDNAIRAGVRLAGIRSHLTYTYTTRLPYLINDYIAQYPSSRVAKSYLDRIQQSLDQLNEAVDKVLSA